MGVPLAEIPQDPLVLDTPVAHANGAWTLPKIEGRLGTAKIAGSADLDATGKIKARIEAGDFSLRMRWPLPSCPGPAPRRTSRRPSPRACPLA